MLLGDLGQYFFGVTIFLSSLFLIMLVLVQRGRGGGLAGALGGPGGQSAFGTKAGDLFTRITIVVATLWIFLCASAVFFLKTKKFVPTSSGTGAISGVSGEASDLMGAGDAAAAQPGLNLDGIAPLLRDADTSGQAEISDFPALDPSGLPLPPANNPPIGIPPADIPAAELPGLGEPETETGIPPLGETPIIEQPAAEPPVIDPPAIDPPAIDPPAIEPPA